MSEHTHNPEHEEPDEVTRRNVERSREHIAERERRRHQEHAKETHPPAPEDALPGQWDIPAGGTTGPNVQGGSSKRQKPN